MIVGTEPQNISFICYKSNNRFSLPKHFENLIFLSLLVYSDICMYLHANMHFWLGFQCREAVNQMRCVVALENTTKL